MKSELSDNGSDVDAPNATGTKKQQRSRKLFVGV